ncbi:MAG: helix-turn-helix transcriptional regulator, partial [Candidatus Bathyarchaeia archaeon]
MRNRGDLRNKFLIVETIKLVRELQKIKQIEIARAINVTKSAYSQFESGRASLSIKKLVSIKQKDITLSFSIDEF